MDVLLGVAIGLVLTFAVVAVIVSSVTELLSGLWRLRAHSLEMGIARLLDGQVKLPRKGIRPLFRRSSEAPTTRAVLEHPLIRSFSAPRANGRPSSYINAVTFATVLLSTKGLASSIPTASLVSEFIADRDRLDARIQALPTGEPGDTVRKAWEGSGNEPAKLVASLLSGDANAVDGLAAVMGSVEEVEHRIEALTSGGDPAAVPIAGAWDNARGVGVAKVADFVRKLDRPDLVTAALGGVGRVKDALNELEQVNPHLGQSLSALWERAGDDFGTFRHEVEDWFDREMERVSGWYSRWAQWIMLGVAFAVAISFNMSAVTIGKALWNDPTLRDRAVAEAQRQVAGTSTTTTSTSATSTTTATSTTATSTTTATTPEATTTTTAVTAPPAADTLREIGLPFGWNSAAWPGLKGYLALHLLGIVLVAIAGSFGAPFWFDALNKFVNLRTTGKPPPTAEAQRNVGSTPS